MFENKSYFAINVGTERSFGIVFAFFFIIIGTYPLLFGGDVRIWSCIISLIFFFLSFFFPNFLYIPNLLWFKLGILLGSIVSPIVMAFIFFITVTPTGLIMRFFRKDIINQKIDKSFKSYWILRKDKIGTMKKQF